MRIDPPPILPTSLLHQEGLLGIIALVGLAIRDRSPLTGLAVRGDLWSGLAVGLAVGLAGAGLLWLCRGLAFFRLLEDWQRELFVHWTATDAIAVAIFSGLAEEALLRALVQPMVGIVPAALGFALLHLLPDRRLWLWPVIAFVMGTAFGLIFKEFGFPAAALAHASVNLIGLLRLVSTNAEHGAAPTKREPKA